MSCQRAKNRVPIRQIHDTTGRMQKTRPPLSAVSLFSGAGGMDIGFQRAGFEVLFANDVDPTACATYRQNHGDVVHEGDLRGFLGELRSLASVDAVFGGPPCQGFSVAGKMNPDDERSRLISTFFDVVDLLVPKCFVCENVKALAVLSRWASVRSMLLERAAVGYHSALVVLNSRDFGVPQGRERMFLVGIRKDLLEVGPGEFQALFAAQLERERAVPPTLKNVLSSFGPAGSQGNPRVCRAKVTYAKVPVLRRSPYAGMLFNGAGRPLPASGHSSTLPASMGGNKTPIVDEEELYGDGTSFVEDYHRRLWNGGRPFSGDAPDRLRRLTVDECLAIQTFPAGYELAGSQSSMYRQIGNAVPCKLAEAVATTMRALLSDAVKSEALLVAAE